MYEVLNESQKNIQGYNSKHGRVEPVFHTMINTS